MKRKGFTLIETVVAIGVFSIFFAAIATIIQQVLQNVGYSRTRAVALTLGQQKMELIRNLPYASAGTVAGIPSGSILQSEIVTINNQPFTVSTSIQYIDDPFDGLAPSDPIPADYKRVRIQISWGGVSPSTTPLTLVSNIVPNGLESNPGGGTLFLQVINAQGQPIPNANVTVTNTVVVPNINLSTLTNSTGNVEIPAAPACISCYNVSVTKAGFSTDRTYTTQEVTNPILPPASVLAGQVTQMTFSIDQLGSLSIKSVGDQSQGYPTIVNVLLTLRGSKIIGHDAGDNPVYKYSFQTTTGGGTVGIPNLEWDNYSVDLSNSNYTLGGSIPLLPYTLSPASASSMMIIADPKYNDSVLVKVQNAQGQLQASASATLSNVPLNFSLTKYTASTGAADFGQAFFNNLSPATYGLVVNLPPYPVVSTSAVVNANIQKIVVVGP